MIQPLLGQMRAGRDMQSFAEAVVDGRVCVVLGAGASQELSGCLAGVAWWESFCKKAGVPVPKDPGVS